MICETDLLLSRLLSAKREETGYSLRQVQKETGVSASTLSRIECCKGSTDAQTRLALANWLELPAETFFGESKDLQIERSDSPLPDLIAGYLANDENLNPSAKEFLETFFRQTYNTAVEMERNGKSLLRNMPQAGGSHPPDSEEREVFREAEDLC